MKTIFCLLLSFLLSGICGCDRIKRNYTTIKTFKVADYEFEINRVIETDKWSGKKVREYMDTSLINLCDFCSDCDKGDGEPMTSHR